MPDPTPPLTLSLQMPDGRHRTELPRHRVARWIRTALQGPGEITVRIVGQEEGQRLNRDFRGKDYATNVLTFDYAQEPVVVADLVLCAPVVEQEAREAGRPLSAHYAHLLVHGTLHAQGYDHESAKEAVVMEALESALLTQLGFDDPWAGARETPRAARTVPGRADPARGAGAQRPRSRRAASRAK
jgi:probable rRNA maturation factor